MVGDRMRQLDRPRRRLAIAIAALAGFVDATGFLAAGGYFTSFMSGNTTRLGVDLVTAPAAAIVPAGILVAFVAGVTVGAIVSERGGCRRKTAVMATTAGLLLLAATLDGQWQAGFIGASVLAMGALNNVFRREGEVAVGVTYMTGALVRLGQGLAAAITRQPMSGRLSAGLLWLGLGSGAIFGAFAFTAWREATPWIAVGIALLLTIVAWRIERAGDQRAI